MQALRNRFQPQHARGHETHLSVSSAGQDAKDYFEYVPVSPTVRSPSLPAITPRMAMTPAISSNVPLAAEHDEEKSTIYTNGETSVTAEATDSSRTAEKPHHYVDLSPEAAVRHSTKFVRRTSGLRKQVAPGDLAMSRHQPDEYNGAYYRPAQRTPGLPRMDTWQGRFAGSSTDVRRHGGQPVEPSPELDLDEHFETELREAVVLSMARSIGLAQPVEGLERTARSSVAPSVSAMSTPNSPMFLPQGRGAKAPFGNVLDMMNASAHNDNLLGGMLREAAMKLRNEDEASDISASVHESAAGTGLGLDAHDKVLRDLEGHLEILYFKKGSKLVGEGEKSPGVYYVIDGFLEVRQPAIMCVQIPDAQVSIPTHPSGYDTPRKASQPPPPTAASPSRGQAFGLALGSEDVHDLPGGHGAGATVDEPLYTVKPGGIAGYLSSLCSTDSYVTITAKTDCFVGFIPHGSLQRIIERRPIVLLTLSKRLISLLSPLVLHIDASLDWMQLSAGQVLYEKGDKSSDFFVVINGRLRSFADKDGDMQVLREYGQNDSIGELDVITAVPRSDTVNAIRDSELVRIPAALFDAISVQHPATTVQFLRLIAKRVKRAMGDQATIARAPRLPPTDVNLRQSFHPILNDADS